MRFSGTTYMKEKEILLLLYISDEYFGMCTKKKSVYRYRELKFPLNYSTFLSFKCGYKE